ncbi:D-2-hydroxyacid dehydrogenase [Caproiciproducens sp. NJN-50]|uniref:D-2-hydroxyacid dehydrogenase n=1 Tax=Acutalibacteraceae TaxID=3082771 RepID=UPI000FFE0D38|nr:MULTISPECIES: D-2-hydroxyacid dehydrogenase [Acutalibacteraceae]QAT50175.1 D-2-hydroxyacid dehydrogenase [Caproiciproducens sp. NJN-50]
MEKKTILFVLPAGSKADKIHREKLQETAPNAEIIFTDSKELGRDLIARANILIGTPPRSLLKYAARLEWFQLFSAGAEQYIAPGILPEGVTLTNATGAYGKSMSEYMLCAALSLLLDFPYYRDNQRQHLWQDRDRSRHILGTTALVIGLGNIGSEFAMRYKALGGKVIGIKRTPGEKPDYLDELSTSDRLNEFLPRADVVTLSLPSTSETMHLFGKDKISLMKPSAVLINVGRGTAVDTDALSDALYEGKIYGAALDVTDPEPLPAEHPLWNAPNTIITPHISGGWNEHGNLERIFEIICANLSRYFSGEPLINVVDMSTGYRRNG